MNPQPKRTRPPTLDEMRAEVAAERPPAFVAPEGVIVCRRPAKRQHRCLWPGCAVIVPEKIFMCRPHWYTLPKRLRDGIWATYSPGQEVRGDPSPGYVEAARSAIEWATQFDARERALKGGIG